VNEEEIKKLRSDYDNLVTSVFRTPAGKELLKRWQELYIEAELFDESERKTCYAIGQRDFVLEVAAKLKETTQ